MLSVNVQYYILQGIRHFKEFTIISPMKKSSPHRLRLRHKHFGSSLRKQIQRNGGESRLVIGGQLTLCPRTWGAFAHCLIDRSLNLSKREKRRPNKSNLRDLGVPEMETLQSHPKHQGELQVLLLK